MGTLLNRRLLLAGISLLAASLACDAPAGQATQIMIDTSSVQPLPTVTPYMVTATPDAAAQPTEPLAAASGKTVSAGANMTVFSPYSVAVPAGWADTHQVAEGVVDTLILTKGAYTLMISQAAGGGGECIFSGTPAEMAQAFASGVGITGTSAQFMRGTNNGGLSWTVCEKGPDTFGFPTSFGYISYKGPSAIDDATLAEMDGMVASLTN